MKIRPLKDKVVLEEIKDDEKNQSGILIPDTVNPNAKKGRVVAAGPGTKTNPMSVKEGDTVLYNKNATLSVPKDGVEYLIIRESEILVVL
jgi:chaperonin GroES